MPHGPYGRPALRRWLGALMVAGTLLGCSDDPVPIPPDHSDLIGTWRHGEPPSPDGSGPHVFVHLTIAPDGTLSYAWYERSEGGHSCSVIPGAPLTAIDDHALEASVVGPFSTELTIDQPPQPDGNRWTMTVDGIELERVSEEADGAAARFTCESGTLVRQGDGNGGRDYDQTI